MSDQDVSRALGRCKMPTGYTLHQLDSGHFMWRHEDSDDESCIHWNKWAIYHGAHADSKERSIAMTNKIEVPRDKLSAVIAMLLEDAPGNPDIILEELRTLLAAQPTHPLIKCLNDNGELIALKATVAQQAQMIEALKYKAELYDEVWTKAIGMGFMNVTMALEKVAAPEAPRQEPVGFRYRTTNGPWELMDESPYADGRIRHRCASEQLEPLYSEPPAPVAVLTDRSFADGIDAAAKFVEAHMDDYINEHGSFDPDTGAVEFPGNGEEYVGELVEISEAIRAIDKVKELNK